MVLRLIQLESESGERQCAVVHDDGSAVLVEGYATTYELCLAALRAGKNMNEFIAPTITKGVAVDYDGALKAGRVLAPIDHPDPAHSVRMPPLPPSPTAPRPLPKAAWRFSCSPDTTTRGPVRAPCTTERDRHRPDAPRLRGWA
jgi:hypothetical protein